MYMSAFNFHESNDKYFCHFIGNICKTIDKIYYSESEQRKLKLS